MTVFPHAGINHRSSVETGQHVQVFLVCKGEKKNGQLNRKFIWVMEMQISLHAGRLKNGRPGWDRGMKMKQSME